MTSSHLAALVVDTGPGCQQDVRNDQVTLPAGGEQGRPHPAVDTVHIRPIQQQHLDGIMLYVWQYYVICVAIFILCYMCGNIYNMLYVWQYLYLLV